MLQFNNLPADGNSEAHEIRAINGPVNFAAVGTFGGDTLTLQVQVFGTWIDVSDGVSTCELTAPGMKIADLRGTLQVRVKRTGSAGTGLKAGIV